MAYKEDVYFKGPILDRVVVNRISKNIVQAKVFYKNLYKDYGIEIRSKYGLQVIIYLFHTNCSIFEMGGAMLFVALSKLINALTTFLLYYLFLRFQLRKNNKFSV